MEEEKRIEGKDRMTAFIAFVNGLPLGALFVSGACMFLLGVGLNSWFTWQQPAPIYFHPAEPTATPLPTATPMPVNVFVNGEVAEPGIYQLPHDAMVQDALAVAGGFTADAFIDIVNLAQPLSDGMHVHVPPLTESTAAIPLISTPPPTSKTDGETAGDLIDLNRASKSDLETLPGVGPSTAQKILDYREDNGPFAIIEDVMNVSGIGPAKFEKMANFITID